MRISNARQLGSLFGRDERVSDSLASHAAGAADAVDVVVAEGRNVVIDDVRDAADVDPATDHVGGDQVPDFRFAETEHHAIAPLLRQVAVDAIDPFQRLARLRVTLSTPRLVRQKIIDCRGSSRFNSLTSSSIFRSA